MWFKSLELINCLFFANQFCLTKRLDQLSIWSENVRCPTVTSGFDLWFSGFDLGSGNMLQPLMTRLRAVLLQNVSGFFFRRFFETGGQNGEETLDSVQIPLSRKVRNDEHGTFAAFTSVYICSWQTFVDILSF